MPTIQEFVDLFNSGDLDVESYFGGYSNFFNILKRRNMLGEIDPINGPDSSSWQNEYLIWLSESDKEKFRFWIQKILQDVEYEGDRPYLVISDRGELSKLFCSRRNDISIDAIEDILSENSDWFGNYHDTTDNVYRDVIEELTPKNIQILYDYIIRSLEGKQIDPNTEVLEIIAEEQGHPEYVTVDTQSVIKIVDDEETMNTLFDDELYELKGNLHSVHVSAYNSAYESEIFDEIWSELGKHFEGNGGWVTKPHPYKKNATVELFKIPINNFESNVLDYLQDNKGYGQSGTLEYHGGYLEMLKDSGDCLSTSVPDYPDHRVVDRNINEYFSDYLY